MKVRHLGLVDYHATWQAMRDFTDERVDDTPDELWVCEHPPVYTLGQAGRISHIHNPADIPVVKSDRGGQVTYHGPGQIIVYTLFNLRRAGFGIREMVVRLENSVIECQNCGFGFASEARKHLPWTGNEHRCRFITFFRY